MNNVLLRSSRLINHVLLNYRSSEGTYAIAKTSGNKEDKKRLGETPTVARANISRCKAEEKDRTFLHFIMRLTSSFLPINFRGCDGKARPGRRSRGKKEFSRPAETFFHARILSSSENNKKTKQRQAREMLTEHVTSLSGTQFRDIKVWLSITHSILAIESSRCLNWN